MGLILTEKEYPECPEVRRKRAGDESYDICELEESLCLVWCGYECDYYEKYLKELKEEENG